MIIRSVITIRLQLYVYQKVLHFWQISLALSHVVVIRLRINPQFLSGNYHILPHIFIHFQR